MRPGALEAAPRLQAAEGTRRGELNRKEVRC
jgi:hypothetical protein